MAFWNNLKIGSLKGGTGYLALDIGSSSIKMVEASIDKSGNHVLALGIAPTPANSIQNNMIVEPKLLAGAIETLVSLKTIETGMIHPTINLENPDPECDLDYVANTKREGKW